MNVTDLKKSIYQKRAEDPHVWFLAGFRNEEIGNFFLRKYLSYYRRLEEEHLETVLGDFPKKKWRLNHRDGDLHRYALMFFGYAIENYLKSILIKNGVNPIDACGKGKLCLNDSITGHNLVSLSDRIPNLSLDESEKKALGNLQKAIVSGKYGVPKRKDQYYPFTADFDQTVIIARKLIRKLKKYISA